MTRQFTLLALIGSAAAGSVEFSTTDLGKRRKIDNIKAGWSTAFSFAGQDLKLATVYDLKAKSDFLKEATLSGSMAPVSYLLTQNFASGVSKLALSTKQAGATFKSVLSGKIDWSSAWLESCNVASVAVVKGAEVAGVNLSFEPSFTPGKKLGKVAVKAGYALGGGASLAAELVATTEGDMDIANLELEYQTEYQGRPVSGTLEPLDQTATVVVTDEVYGIVTATYKLGGEPKVTAKRAFSF